MAFVFRWDGEKIENTGGFVDIISIEKLCALHTRSSENPMPEFDA